MPEISLEPTIPPWGESQGLSDWTEALMFVENRTYLSRSDLRKRLAGALSTEKGDIDLQVDLVLAEVANRNRAAISVYPFAEQGTGVARVPEVDATGYEFLLWLSVSPKYRDEKRYGEIETLFDNLVLSGLKYYLGSDAQALRFGSPVDGGRPTNFPEAVKWLCDKLDLGSGAATPRPKSKDGGVDIVVWKSFKDRRSGFVTILCQCTVELEWTHKAKDIVAGVWNGWIDFGSDPVTALAIPFSVSPTFDRWDETRRTVTLVLDRMRICELLEVSKVPVPDAEKMQAWSDKERSMLSDSAA